MNPTVKWSIVIICLMLIWFSIVGLFYLKADEVTKHPCQVCSERMGEKVTCTYEFDITKGFGQPAQVTFYPNDTDG